LAPATGKGPPISLHLELGRLLDSRPIIRVRGSPRGKSIRCQQHDGSDLQSIARLLNQVHNDSDGRYLAYGDRRPSGNRGVEGPATGLNHASSLFSRFESADTASGPSRVWQVGATAGIIDPLYYSILAPRSGENCSRTPAASWPRRFRHDNRRQGASTCVPPLLNLLDVRFPRARDAGLGLRLLDHHSPAPRFGRKNAGRPWRAWWLITSSPKKHTKFPSTFLLLDY